MKTRKPKIGIYYNDTTHEATCAGCGKATVIEVGPTMVGELSPAEQRQQGRDFVPYCLLCGTAFASVKTVREHQAARKAFKAARNPDVGVLPYRETAVLVLRGLATMIERNGLPRPVRGQNI